MKPIRAFVRLAVFSACVSLFPACGDGARLQIDDSNASENPTIGAPATSFDSSYAREWIDVVLDATRADALNPLRGARVQSYTAIALYESVVNGSPQHRSLAGQLNELDTLPQPSSNQAYDWPVVMAETMI